jgi:hypothetical protein
MILEWTLNPGSGNRIFGVFLILLVQVHQNLSGRTIDTKGYVAKSVLYAT